MRCVSFTGRRPYHHRPPCVSTSPSHPRASIHHEGKMQQSAALQACVVHIHSPDALLSGRMSFEFSPISPSSFISTRCLLHSALVIVVVLLLLYYIVVAGGSVLIVMVLARVLVSSEVLLCRLRAPPHAERILVSI